MRALSAVLNLGEREDFEGFLEEAVGKDNFLADGIQGMGTLEKARVHYVFRGSLSNVEQSLIEYMTSNSPCSEVIFSEVDPEYSRYLDEPIKGRFKQLSGR